MSEQDEREAVVSEAMTWLCTPFQHEARVKGAGCDCGRFLIAVFSKVGLMADYEPPHVPVSWHLHPDSPTFDPDMYSRQIQRFGHEITGPPQKGDVAMFWWGKAYSHSAIVIEWPTKLIHCFFIAGVQLVDASIDPFLLRHTSKHPVRFFSAWGKP